MKREALLQRLGPIDIYLLDQIMRGRFENRRKILDLGCGTGRNLVYFLQEGFEVPEGLDVQQGFEVFAIDRDPAAVEAVRQLAARHGHDEVASRFRTCEATATPFEDEAFDAVICCAVLHFCRDAAEWRLLVGEAWRLLRPGGLLFVRLSTTIGVEAYLTPVQGWRYRLPSGVEWLLADETTLVQTTSDLGGTLADPIKTTVVQNQRAMTTWVILKPSLHEQGKVA